MTSGARIAVAAASFAALLALVAGGRGAEWTFAAAVVVFPVALSALGASRRGRLGRPLLLPLAGLLTFLAGSFFLLFLLRGHLADGPWIAGVPLAPAVLLVGVWLLPLALVGLAYALTFDHHGVDEDDLRRLRAMRPAPPASAEEAPHPPARAEEAPHPPTSAEEAPHPPTSAEEAPPGAVSKRGAPPATSPPDGDP